MTEMNTMVAEMVGGIVMANGGKVEYDIPNTRKRLTIMVEDREPTDEEKIADITEFLKDEIGLEMTEPDFSEPCVCFKLDEFIKVMEKYREK